MKITKQMNGGDVITCPTFHMGKGLKPTKRTNRIAMNLKRLPFGLFWYIRFHKLRVCLDGGIEKWKNKNCGRIKKWEDGKYLVFPLMCLVGGVEKWENGKLFCLVGEKNGRIKNVIYINWLLYPLYIICKK